MGGTDAMPGDNAVMTNQRLRDLGFVLGNDEPGRHNAITDVPGVRVGHHTLRRPPNLHTGVTAVVPTEVSPRAPLAAGLFAGNGYGKLIGATQLAELGMIETPIVLTATLSAFLAADALVGWMLDRPECAEVRSLNPVVGECNDGFLSDIRSRSIRPDHVRAALDEAADGPVPLGCVGAGTGTGALGFKAGIGSASRVLPPIPTVGPTVGPAAGPSVGPATDESTGGATDGPPDSAPGQPITIGALVQANFGGRLRFRGREIPPEPGNGADASGEVGGAGSCMVVVATDAPLDARQLTRVARRAVFGLGRVGAAYGHGSGDYGIAFSTNPGMAPPDRALDGIFTATLDIVEEAVLDSLLAAVPTTGREGRTLPVLSPADLGAPDDGGAPEAV